jgi:hypothetical protein
MAIIRYQMSLKRGDIRGAEGRVQERSRKEVSRPPTCLPSLRLKVRLLAAVARLAQRLHVPRHAQSTLGQRHNVVCCEVVRAPAVRTPGLRPDDRCCQLLPLVAIATLCAAHLVCCTLGLVCRAVRLTAKTAAREAHQARHCVPGCVTAIVHWHGLVPLRACAHPSNTVLACLCCPSRANA